MEVLNMNNAALRKQSSTGINKAPSDFVEGEMR
jgi:hypothetical protein